MSFLNWGRISREKINLDKFLTNLIDLTTVDTEGKGKDSVGREDSMSRSASKKINNLKANEDEQQESTGSDLRICTWASN